MAVEKKAKKKARGRPRKLRRPVIAIRVHEFLYEQICASAAEHKKTLSEEAEHRLDQSFKERSNNLLGVIVRSTIGTEPKYVAADREMKFSPSIKGLMKARIAAFIDSLPEGEESSLSKEEADELWDMVQRHQAARAVVKPGARK